jgi:FkbH-like protein
MVAVPELPADPANYVQCLAEAGYFESVAFTVDDQARSAQYAANTARERLRESTETIDQFLRSLNMSAELREFARIDLARITQLINKTNQFNPTTQRYTLDDVTKFAESPEYVTVQSRLFDNFGDNGLVSAVILRPDSDQPDILTIDTWVMSCRVFGRQLEVEIMNAIVEIARLRRFAAIRAQYIPTDKNGRVRDLFPSLGFNRVQCPGNNGGTSWLLRTADYTPRETYIVRRAS